MGGGRCPRISQAEYSIMISEHGTKAIRELACFVGRLAAGCPATTDEPLGTLVEIVGASNACVLELSGLTTISISPGGWSDINDMAERG